jgi:hypothetical protein
MGCASGHRESVSFLTYRTRPRWDRTSRATPVRSRNEDKRGHTPGVCYYCQDLITGSMSTKQGLILQPVCGW